MLLYRTAEWHAFAKLWLHTESTLQHIERLTTELGQSMQNFRDAMQSGFVTFKLLKETGVCNWCQKVWQGKREGSFRWYPGCKPKILNLFTYKWHALGDYICTIHLFGGTDRFSTQVVSNTFFMIFSQLLAARVNLLIKLLNDCMDWPTNTMQSNKLPCAIKDLNVPIWHLTRSSSMPILSKNQWITRMIRQRVTWICSITSLHQKIDLWTYLTPFGITEVTLLTMYAASLILIIVIVD